MYRFGAFFQDDESMETNCDSALSWSTNRGTQEQVSFLLKVLDTDEPEGPGSS